MRGTAATKADGETGPRSVAGVPQLRPKGDRPAPTFGGLPCSSRCSSCLPYRRFAPIRKDGAWIHMTGRFAKSLVDGAEALRFRHRISPRANSDLGLAPALGQARHGAGRCPLQVQSPSAAYRGTPDKRARRWGQDLRDDAPGLAETGEPESVRLLGQCAISRVGWRSAQLGGRWSASTAEATPHSTSVSDHGPAARHRASYPSDRINERRLPHKCKR